MLFPTSSLLHKGVVDVPQFAQLRAPTAPAAPGVFAFGRILPLASGEGAGDDDGAGAGEVVDVAPPVVAGVVEAASALLLKVGQPEQAVVPPVPSHRPSPGHVPARCVFV